MRVRMAALILFIGIAAQAQEHPVDCKPATIDCTSWRYQITDPVADYDDTVRKATAYFAAHPEKKEDRDGEWVAYLRWLWFAESRISIDPKGRKNLLKANQKMYDLWRTRTVEKTAQATIQGATGICTTSGSIPSNWLPHGPGNQPTTASGATISPNGIGIVVELEVDPSDPSGNTIYAGTARSGLFKTTNGGFTWMCLTCASQLPGMGILDIALAPGAIYIATGSGLVTGYSIGILKSIDGGLSWNTTGLTFTQLFGITPRRIAVDPHTGDVYALVNQTAYRSTDGGSTWTQSVPPGTAPNELLRDIEFHPTLPGIIYIASERYGTNSSHAWRSADNGTTWSIMLTGSERIELAVSPKDPDGVWAQHATGVNSSPTVLERSADKGVTWSTPKTTFLFAADYWANVLRVSAVDTGIIYAGALQTFKSSNGGTTFTKITDRTIPSTHFQHDDMRALVIIKATLGGAGDRVVTGNDGGVNETTDGGITWHDITGGMNITQFYGLGGTEMDPSIALAGTQDNTSNIYDGVAWHNTSTLYCDGGDGIIDPTNPALMYALCNGNLKRTMNGGATWASASPPTTPHALDIPIALDPVTPNTIYAAYDAVWQSNDQGNTWKKISPSQNAQMIALAIAPSNPNIIYAARYFIAWGQPVGQVGAMNVTFDGGMTWNDVSPGLGVPLQWTTATDVVVDPKNPLRAWVSFGGFNADIYHTDDGGQNWNAMPNVGLPGLPVNRLLYERCTNDRLYAATDAGVFAWNGASWECFNQNLRIGIVTDLEANYAGGTIRAATMGSGLWESLLPLGATANCTCVPPPAAFALWTPLDETSGTTIRNIAGTNGTATGATPGPGRIAGARCFTGTAAIDIPSYTNVNVAGGPFTIDAWIKPTSNNGNQVIVDKRTSTRGYALYLNGGFPSVFLADNTGSSTFTANAPVPIDGAYHHVTVTVRRPGSPLGTFYIDGAPVGTFNPAARANSLSSAAIVRIGARANPPGEFFQGCIDEVEVFRDVLSATVVQRIATANAGKCKSFCTATTSGFCQNNNTTTAQHRICNNTLQLQTYQYLFTSIPASGTSCTLAGPLNFNPTGGAITIPPGQCQTMTVTITRPTWLTGGGTGCYQILVSGTTDSFSCQNVLHDWSSTCTNIIGDKSQTNSN